MIQNHPPWASPSRDSATIRAQLRNNIKSQHVFGRTNRLSIGRAHDRVSYATQGGAKGIRTPDLLHALEARYQLRRSPNDHRMRPSESISAAALRWPKARGRCPELLGVSALIRRLRGVSSATKGTGSLAQTQENAFRAT